MIGVFRLAVKVNQAGLLEHQQSLHKAGRRGGHEKSRYIDKVLVLDSVVLCLCRTTVNDRNVALLEHYFVFLLSLPTVLVYPAECSYVPYKLCEKLRKAPRRESPLSHDWQSYHTTPIRVLPHGRERQFNVQRSTTMRTQSTFSRTCCKLFPDLSSPLTSTCLNHGKIESPSTCNQTQNGF
jgi:hypothetical protein